MREEYGERYGQRFEAKFFAAASKGAAEARRLFRDWETEVDARIEAIRAQRTGQGVSLTPRQARALAGEWYEWFLARHPVSEEEKWEDLRDRVHEALEPYRSLGPSKDRTFRRFPYFAGRGRRRNLADVCLFVRDGERTEPWYGATCSLLLLCGLSSWVLVVSVGILAHFIT